MKTRVAVRHDELDVATGVKVGVVQTLSASGFNGTVSEFVVLRPGEEKSFEVGEGQSLSIEECELPAETAESEPESA